MTAWVQGFCARREIELVEVEASDLDSLAGAIGTRADLVWIEVPSNPWMRVVDIAAAAELAHGAGAVLAVAEYLQAHRSVEAVWYPGLESHPQHDLAVRQMDDGFGGLMSVIVKGGARIMRF